MVEVKEKKLRGSKGMLQNSIANRKTMRIHGKWYDVSKFDHPGGPVSLSHGYGRDATALFEGHHPFVQRDKLAAMMKKYELSEEEVDARGIALRDRTEDNMMDADGKYVSPFEWGTDFAEVGSAFWVETRERVRGYFEGEAARRGVGFREATKATPRRFAEMGVLALLVVGMLPFYFAGWWFSLLVLPTLLWMYAVNTLHDGSHFAVSTNWLVNLIFSYSDFPAISPLMWNHQHVIGHHAYPNVGRRDPDLAHAPAVMRLHPSVRWKPPHRFQAMWTLLIWTFGSALYFTVVPIKAVLLGQLNRAVKVQRLSRARVALHLLGRLISIFLIFGWPWLAFPWPKALAFALVPVMVHSFLFMLNTQLNHFTPDTTSHSSACYYAHQIVTAHTFAADSYFAYIFSGGLNLQAAHHVFPTVNHVHLPIINGIVRECAIKHGVHWEESASYVEALSKFVKHLTAMSHKE